MLYENKNYKVTLPTDAVKYEVVNKETGVVEFTEASLPRCIIVALEYDQVLDKYLPKEPVEETAHAPNVVPLR